METDGMDRVEVLDENETGMGWRFRVRITRDGGIATEHEVRLSWVDHDFWSGGASAPARVVQALMEYVIERGPVEAIPDRVDASTIRRRHPEVDDVLGTRL